MVLMLSAPAAAGARASLRRCCRTAASWVPDYGLPSVPGRTKKRVGHSSAGSVVPTRKWWDYASPSASIGRPRLGLKLVSIPQVSPGGGSGGGGGGRRGGGGGGNGGGDDPMKGFTYLFSSLIFAGGLMAYIRKGSSNSLLVSAAVATLLLISTSLMHHRSGKLLALGTCLVLAAMMGHRANTSRKVFPAGIVAILSALMTAGYARSLA